jgi:hypothetical protein
MCIIVYFGFKLCLVNPCFCLEIYLPQKDPAKNLYFNFNANHASQELDFVFAN